LVYCCCYLVKITLYVAHRTTSICYTFIGISFFSLLIFGLPLRKIIYERQKQFSLYQKMSTNNNNDIKKLYALSRLEIDESEIQKTSDKIKEIILFFNKLDEFESNGEQEIQYNYMKTEKNIDELRDDITTLNLNDDDGGELERATPFSFPNRKNGYIIGPRI
jgi:aspartyl/glutamyl-tRNA(Asn/Gln) amidotransferase C subunit